MNRKYSPQIWRSTYLQLKSDALEDLRKFVALKDTPQLEQTATEIALLCNDAIAQLSLVESEQKAEIPRKIAIKIHALISLLTDEETAKHFKEFEAAVDAHADELNDNS